MNIVKVTYRYRGEHTPAYTTDSKSLHSSDISVLSSYKEQLLDELITKAIHHPINQYEQTITDYLKQKNVVFPNFTTEDKAALYGLSDITVKYGQVHYDTESFGHIKGGSGVALIYIDEGFIDYKDEEEAHTIRNQIADPETFPSVINELEHNEALFVDGKIYDRSSI